MRFAGRTVAVTGATRGIGAAVAALLHDEGAYVVAVARDAQRGEQLVAKLGPDRVHFVAGDVGDPSTATSALEACVAAGGPHALINNAAMDHTNDLLEVTDGEVRDVFDVNFFGALWMLQAFAAQLKERGDGAIVNVTSRLASIGVPTMGIYGASKGALLALTRGAAVELAAHGVRVNAVAPGFTETPLVRSWIEEQRKPAAARERIEGEIPLGRLGSPEDVAAAIAFLASDDAAHITGASLPVDGGYTAT